MRKFLFTIDGGALTITKTATGRDMWSAWESLGYSRDVASFKMVSWAEVPALPVEG